MIKRGKFITLYYFHLLTYYVALELRSVIKLYQSH